MANKELTFGCLIKTSEDETEMICSKLVNEWTSFATISYPEGRWCWFTTIYHLRDSEWINLDSKRTIKEIIGHPIMIGNVLDWIDKKMWVSNCEYEEFVVEEANISVLLWREYLKPIEEQSDECVDYIYSLISKGNE